jgi:Flp pilus assembly protein CpaB
MSATTPAATRLQRPRWGDPRLVAGVLCLALSVLLGARLLGSADDAIRVWALTRALPGGTELTADDLRPERVRLFGSAAARYVSADEGASPAGRVLARDVGAGELLPVAALLDPGAEPAQRLVTVPVDRDHALGGELTRGDVVDIVATTKDGARSTTTPVLLGVTVVDVVRPGGGFGGGTGDFAIVVAVAPEQALTLAAAVQGAALDVLKVVGRRAGSSGPAVASPTATPTP